jgi:large subunit ribosomal protein L29
MKASELRKLSTEELVAKEKELKQELFNLRFQIATRKIKNHQRIPQVKKDIARIMTALRERELMQQYAGIEGEEAVVASTAAPTATERRSLLGRLGRGRK